MIDSKKAFKITSAAKSRKHSRQRGAYKKTLRSIKESIVDHAKDGDTFCLVSNTLTDGFRDLNKADKDKLRVYLEKKGYCIEEAYPGIGEYWNIWWRG